MNDDACTVRWYVARTQNKLLRGTQNLFIAHVWNMLRGATETYVFCHNVVLPKNEPKTGTNRTFQANGTTLLDPTTIHVVAVALPIVCKKDKLQEFSRKPRAATCSYTAILPR